MRDLRRPTHCAQPWPRAVDVGLIPVGARPAVGAGRWERCAGRRRVPAAPNWPRRRLLYALAAVGTGLSAGCLPWISPAESGKARARVGYLTTSTPDYAAPGGVTHFDVFRGGLRELGYTEDRNLRLEARFARLQFEDVPHLAAELVSLPVDVLVVGDTRSIQPARQATSTIPVVFVLSTDPVFSRHVESLARPGGNLTGLTMAPLETMGKRLELLREAVPNLKHAAMLYNNGDQLAQRGSAAVARTAAALDLSYTELHITKPPDLADAVQRAVHEGVDGLVVWGDPLVNANAGRLAELTIAAALPTIGISREVAEAGILMSYAPSLPALFRRAATYVDRILRGTPPATIPVERPTHFDLVINLRTATALGLQLGDALLREADDVIR